MTDLAQGDATTIVPTDTPPSTIIKFALKNGAGEVEVDTGKLPDEVYKEAVLQGLKVIAERNMSKITKAAYPVEAERKAAIAAKAQANIQDMYDGKTKLTGAGPKTKVAGKVMTEAMRLARALIKDALRQAKIKQSSVGAKELTAAAKQYISEHPDLLATAETNLKAREETPKIDLSALIKNVSALPKVTPPKPPLSKAQAGKVQGRVAGIKGKPTSPQATA
jgi:hypothetical protein